MLVRLLLGNRRARATAVDGLLDHDDAERLHRTPAREIQRLAVVHSRPRPEPLR